MPDLGDIRDLIGRYAAGSLSDAERRRLFDAALEDQDLFDELSREHSLKQLIDSPGARDRLIAALAPPPAASSWKKNLIWVLAAMFVIGMSSTAVIIMRNSLRPTQVAQLQEPTQPPAPPQAAPSQPPPVKREPKRTASSQPARLADRIEIHRLDSAPVPALPPARAAASPGAVATGSIAGGGGGGRIAAPRAQAPAPQRAFAIQPQAEAAKLAAPPFSLQYSVEDQDIVFKFLADGYFSIHFTPGQDTIVDSQVAAGSTRRERMPLNTTEIYVTYSAQAQSSLGGIDVNTRNRTDTLTDPDRTRIELLIRLYQ